MVLSKIPWIRHIIQAFQILSTSRFSTGHMRCMSFEGGKRSFPICTKCNINPFSPRHILKLLGFSFDEAAASPCCSLTLYRFMNSCGSGLVKLDQMGISPTTTAIVEILTSFCNTQTT
ncbi:RNase H domain-containing protein [Trichonephila clavipes]|nr:RNase H domain-containing protein [Trichonephila clavipes]